MDPTLERQNPQHQPTFVRTTISRSYNPVTHFSRLGFNRKSSGRRAQSPPPKPPILHPETLKRTLSNSVSLDKNPYPPPRSIPQQDRQNSKTTTATVKRVFHDTPRFDQEKKKSVLVVVNNSHTKEAGHRNDKGLMSTPTPTPVGGAGAEQDDKEEVKRTEPVKSTGLVGVTATKGKGKLLHAKRVSFGDEHYSEEDLANFMATNGVKVVSADMPPYMQIHAVGCARKARDSLEKFTSKALALSLKKEFDGVYGPAWHCIVGTSFGSFVTHSIGGFLYFSMDHKLYILLFKTTVQKVAD